MTTNNEWYCRYFEGHRCPDKQKQCSDCRDWQTEMAAEHRKRLRKQRAKARLNSPWSTASLLQRR